MKRFSKYYQIECTDNKGERHFWRFPFDAEGYKEVCGFKSWLFFKHRKEGYHNFAIWHN